ncbi:MAG: methylenetetrahydrofolate--tRNA-(uracil(54)-C(5))-methyltransferase (FADH(2)-oxidizing) TrmFO [Hyphomicrobiales bacterium]|nr:methylenetetrahydrofolate--tRNA-(uracil(54)-C(5))-methyltransferase (FADH(2)-oxidizing) TrmFO [Hyphomicrobiales bacterium]
MPSQEPIHVIGAGLAGSEAAWQIARQDIPVVIHEMRPLTATPVHKTAYAAELVCSNSFRSDDALHNAVGLLHEEMRRLDSLIMRMGDAHKLPAGGALAVDRDGFAAAVTQALESHRLISIERGEVRGIPSADWGETIIATGPLTSASLAEAIRGATGIDELAFFDAIAPIVHRDTIDMDVVWRQSRYDKVGPGGSGADYLNCPMTRPQYEAFIDAVLAAPKTEFREFETSTPYFDGCLPIEVMAERGRETLRHGPMKPVGLTDPRNPTIKPYAVVQLRQDNALGTLFNMVGFQTKLRHGEQTRVFRMIPGLEKAEFARLGGLHRNTYLNSPKVLDAQLRLKSVPRLRFAGQITGCEGYVESAAIGLLAGRFTAAERRGETLSPPPQTTAIGSLLAHITGGHLLGENGEIEAAPSLAPTDSNGSVGKARSFQPMNVNFGLFLPLQTPVRGQEGERLRGVAKAQARKRAMSARALCDLASWQASGVCEANRIGRSTS